MNKFLTGTLILAAMTSVASAADFGYAQQPAITYAAPASSWTGFYAGIFGGVASSKLDLNVSASGTSLLDIGFNGGGLLGGVQVGADYQWDQIVLGAVADIALTDIGSEITFSEPTTPASATISSRLKHLGTIRARAGFVPNDLTLVYAHGGLAYAGTEQSASMTVAGTTGSVTDIKNPNHWGYTVGAGLEYRVTENISFQTEYAYTNLGEQSIYSEAVSGFDLKQTLQHHQIKAGINFRF